MVLNLCRDSKFDSIPSFSLKKGLNEQTENIDLTYW